MSTKAIREALDLLAEAFSSTDLPDVHGQALSEVEAIEKAARDLMTPQNPKEKAYALMGRIARESTT